MDPGGQAASGSYRVLRGGSWRDNADGCPVARRYSGFIPSDSNIVFGFRVARSSEPSNGRPGAK